VRRETDGNRVGIWICSGGGKHLGNIDPPKMAANLAWEIRTPIRYTRKPGRAVEVRLNIGGVRPERGKPQINADERQSENRRLSAFIGG